MTDVSFVSLAVPNPIPQHNPIQYTAYCCLGLMFLLSLSQSQTQFQNTTLYSTQPTAAAKSTNFSTLSSHILFCIFCQFIDIIRTNSSITTNDTHIHI